MQPNHIIIINNFLIIIFTSCIQCLILIMLKNHSASATSVHSKTHIYTCPIYNLFIISASILLSLFIDCEIETPYCQTHQSSLLKGFLAAVINLAETDHLITRCEISLCENLLPHPPVSCWWCCTSEHFWCCCTSEHFWCRGTSEHFILLSNAV